MTTKTYREYFTYMGCIFPTPQTEGEKRRNDACQWFATKWRAIASEIGVKGAARLMRKQGIPCEVAVSILATR